jgi:hypothetical protein
VFDLFLLFPGRPGQRGPSHCSGSVAALGSSGWKPQPQVRADCKVALRTGARDLPQAPPPITVEQVPCGEQMYYLTSSRGYVIGMYLPSLNLLCV